jgi:ABC-type oligopeptide transport system substrate-binding subunit
LTQPYYDWPTVLTHPGLVPIPKQAERDIDQFLSKPVGNGSFQMARPWTSGEPVLLKSFADAIKPPFLDGIRFFPFEDAAASWAAFDDGDLDVAEVPVGRFDYAAETYGQDGVKPLLAGYYYGLNLRSKNLRKDRLRKAVTLAIDREEIADEIYKQTMQAPRGVIPAGAGRCLWRALCPDALSSWSGAGVRKEPRVEGVRSLCQRGPAAVRSKPRVSYRSCQRRIV